MRIEILQILFVTVSLMPNSQETPRKYLLNECMLKMHSKCKVKELCLLYDFLVLSELPKFIISVKSERKTSNPQNDFLVYLVPSHRLDMRKREHKVRVKMECLS